MYGEKKEQIRAATRALRRARLGTSSLPTGYEDSATARRDTDSTSSAALAVRDAWLALLSFLGIGDDETFSHLLPALFIPTRLEPDIRLILAAHSHALLPALATSTGEPVKEPAWTYWQASDISVKELLASGPRRPSLEVCGPSLLARADIILLPALAVDAWGNRIGQGGGWYDRALAHAAPQVLLVAAIHEDEWHDTVLPHLSHDRPVDAVISPKGFRLLSSQAVHPRSGSGDHSS